MTQSMVQMLPLKSGTVTRYFSSVTALCVVSLLTLQACVVSHQYLAACVWWFVVGPGAWTGRSADC